MLRWTIPAVLMAPKMFPVLALSAALAAVCAGAVVRINMGGGPVAPDWRCDTGKFVTSANSLEYESPFVVQMPVGGAPAPIPVFETFRFSHVGDLTVQVPVPSGLYEVILFFADVWDGSGPDIREFIVNINGNPVEIGGSTVLSVFDRAGGLDKPYVIRVMDIPPVAGMIDITLGRIVGKDNPILNGLVIEGPNADSLVGAEGLGSCTTSVFVPSTASSPSFAAAPIVQASVPAVPPTGPSIPLSPSPPPIVTAPSASPSQSDTLVPTSVSPSASASAPLPSNEPVASAMLAGPAPSSSTLPSQLSSAGAVATLSASASSSAVTIPSVSKSATVTSSPSVTVSSAPSEVIAPSAANSISVSPTHSVIIPSSSSSMSSSLIPSLSSSASAPAPLPSTNSSIVPFAAAPTTTNGEITTVKINVGGKAEAPDWRCDTGKFISSPSVAFTSQFANMADNSALGPAAMFESHRWTNVGDMSFKLPVPPGSYAVSLLFAENWKNSGPNVRKFTVTINGQAIQTASNKTEVCVFLESGGLDMPYALNAGSFPPVGGVIEITLGRVAGKNNPMLSGIVLSGPGADKVIGSEGLGSCTAAAASPSISVSSVPSPSSTAGTVPVTSAAPTSSPMSSKAMPSPPPSVPPICGKEVETEFSEKHFAHAVTGGPYVETDFKKLGFTAVNLDGTNSHSHFQSDTESGKIVTYKWMWTDPSNPASDADGMMTVTTAKSTQNFPLGVTTITLLVIDQFCNSATESSTVTINSATFPGAYCYYYDFDKQVLDTISLPVSQVLGPRPKYGMNVGDINFANTLSFGNFSFKENTFAVRCSFFIDVGMAGEIEYKLIHNGPVKAYHAGSLVASSDSMAADQMTVTTKKQFAQGLQEWQIMYLRPSTMSGKLIFQFASGAVIPENTVRHDTAATMPIITGSNKNSGSVEELILIFGLSFVNNVQLKFGDVEASTIESTSGVIQARIPPGTGTVNVTVTTAAGVSNAMMFKYVAAESFPIKFSETTVKTTAGEKFEIQVIAVVKYGPDGRLYCGATNSMIYALTLNKNLQVTKKCEKNVWENWPRAVLGIGFNPTSNTLKMFFSTSTIFWKEKNIIANSTVGWKNGKIKSVTMSGPNGCFNNDVSDVVTGLPVSNHDHAVQAIQFLPGGKMIVSVGGFTNGGISVPGDKLGGFPSNPLAGALVECPVSGGNIVYSSSDPLKAQIVSGGCKTYATGFRNSFGMEYHTNNKLYASDNGPNQGFGAFSTDCVGGQTAAKNIADKLILVEPGKCHGHPSINRGLAGNVAECAFEDARCVKPLIKGLQSSTNGVMEYRSNVFREKLKGNLFLSKYTGGGEGRVSRVILNGAGKVATNGFTNIFWPKSGLSLVEGPRGELVMSRVFKKEIFVLTPSYETPTAPFFISVMPRMGPAAGGNRVLVTGHNFGATPGAFFGTKACSNMVVLDGDSFTCVVPGGNVNEQVGVSITSGATTVAVGIGSDYWYF